MQFILNNSAIWTLSWILWMFCALGVAPDLTAEVLYAFVIPKTIAPGISENSFLILETIASHLTGYFSH